jgi:gluconokinase
MANDGNAQEIKAMIIILMGVSGSGKTTIGSALAKDLHWNFYDADDFHPQNNLDKMRRAIPLTDEDRKPWLDSLHSKIRTLLSRGESAVLACSALKQSYRNRLLIDHTLVQLVYLKGDYDLIRKRLEARHNHFMPSDLLGSQFELLEEPGNGIVIDASTEPENIIRAIKNELRL